MNAVPSIHVPEDLTLCGENANVTMLQGMLMSPQPLEKSTSKAPTRKSAGRNKSRRSVQFAPVAGKLAILNSFFSMTTKYCNLNSGTDI